jgi:hypothetical protein
MQKRTYCNKICDNNAILHLNVIWMLYYTSSWYGLTVTICIAYAKSDISKASIWQYTFIACWWGKYENLFTQEYHISQRQRPRGIWYSWVNKFSYFLNPHAINVLLYRMKPRKHIHVKYCWQTYFKSIGTLSQTFKNHIHNNIITVACKWCIPSASDVFLSKNGNSGGKTCEASEGVEYDIYFTEYDFCPVWSRVLIFTHCPIKLIYLWLLIYEV